MRLPVRVGGWVMMTHVRVCPSWRLRQRGGWANGTAWRSTLGVFPRTQWKAPSIKLCCTSTIASSPVHNLYVWVGGVGGGVCGEVGGTATTASSPLHSLCVCVCVCVCVCDTFIWSLPSKLHSVEALKVGSTSVVWGTLKSSLFRVQPYLPKVNTLIPTPPHPLTTPHTHHTHTPHSVY